MESDMSTMTVEAQVAPRVTPGQAIAESRSRTERFSSWFREKWEQTKGWLRRAWNWTRDKVVRAYHWTRDQVILPAVDWTVRNTKRAAFWIRDTAVRFWNWATPFRAWIVGSAVVVADAAITVWSWLVLGPKLWLLAMGLGLVVGGIVAHLRRKRAAEKVEIPMTIPGDSIMIPTLDLTEQQEAALASRLQHLSQSARAAAENNNKPLSSNHEGRLYLVTMRLNGDDRPALAVYDLYRLIQERDLGVEDAAERYVWASVKKGMVEEDKQVKKLLAETAGETV
jgi:hypothetical protein